MSDEIKLCMIGAGQHAGWNIYPHFPLLKGGRVVANADLNLEKAQQQARRVGIANTYSDYQQMLAKEKPDGVIVCINSTMHARLAPELLDAGYHVYTEKPNCNTLAECVKVREAARRNKKICMTAYKKRFAPAYQRTRAIIASETFGQPVLLNLLRTRGPFKISGNPTDNYMLQWGCHAIDLLTYLFGNVSRLSAITTGAEPQAYAIHLQYASGAVGTFTVSERVAGRNIEEVTAIGAGGVVIKTHNSIEMMATKNQQPFEHYLKDFVNGAANGGIEQGFVGELQAFIDAIRTGQPPEANIEQGTHTMAVYEAIEKSAAAKGALTDVAVV
jgi:predicted dehydrogenase